MFNCFINYAQIDRRFPENFSRFPEAQGLSTFIASLSLSPGSEWADETKQALSNGKWIFFLANKSACTGPAVLPEVGGVIFSGKKLGPIVRDMNPSMLFAWAGRFQAIDLGGKSSEQVLRSRGALVKRLRGEKLRGQMVGLAVLTALALTLLGNVQTSSRIWRGHG